MDVLDAIVSRRSVPKVRPDPIPRALIEQILFAAAQAPNHFRVRPWRFIVMEGNARKRLAEAMVEGFLRRQPDATLVELEKESLRPMRAPVVIAVAVDPPGEPKVIEVENIAAAAAAVQNLLLAAHGLGLGAMWRTGPAAQEPIVKRFLGLAEEQHLIGFVYVGWPASEPEPSDRPSFDDRTTWLSD